MSYRLFFFLTFQKEGSKGSQEVSDIFHTSRSHGELVWSWWELHWSNYLSKSGKHQVKTYVLCRNWKLIKCTPTGLQYQKLCTYLKINADSCVFTQVYELHQIHTEIHRSVLLLNNYIFSIIPDNLIWQIVKPSFINSKLAIRNVWLVYSTCHKYRIWSVECFIFLLTLKWTNFKLARYDFL